MPSPLPSTTLANRIVTITADLKTLERDLLAAGNQELAQITRLAYLEFMQPAVTGFINKVGVDSRSIKGNI